MTDALVIIQILCALMGLASAWFVGSLTLIGPLLSFSTGIPFVIFYLITGYYYIIPMTLTWMALDARCFIKWYRAGVPWWQ